MFNIGKNKLTSPRDFFNGLSFHVKLIISIIFGISILVTVSAWIIILNIQSNIDRQVITLNHNLKITQLLSQDSVDTLNSNMDILSKKKALDNLINKSLKTHNGILYVIFTDHTGKVLSKSLYSHLYVNANFLNNLPLPRQVPYLQITDSQSGRILNIAEPIQKNQRLLGCVWIGIPDTGFTLVGSRKELVFFLVEIFLLVWILSVTGAIVNSLIIMRPLRKLEKGAKAISDGRFGFQLPLQGLLGRELSQLVKAFNIMSKRLRQYEESNLATLSSERNKFESVVMSIVDGVIVLDKGDIIQIVNPNAKRLLNRSGDELIGQKATQIWDLKTNLQIDNFLNSIKSESKGNFHEYASFELVRDDRNLKLIITPLYSLNNEKLGSVIVINDKTRDVEIERIKQEFMSNVSHELRTPITSIKCYVDTLCSHGEQIENSTKREFLSIINEETDRLSSMVNDVLELSVLESPTNKLQLTLQNIYPSIDYAIKSIAVLANKKLIALIKDIEEDLPELNINQENLERVLINLLSNAIKYTPGNGMVRLSIRKSAENVLFQIIDNGIGIHEEHLPSIFDRFYRVENKVHTIKGTGLGLTIVKKSIEQHGGSINVRSKLGEGSIFEFILPVPNNESKVSTSNQLTNKKNESFANKIV